MKRPYSEQWDLSTIPGGWPGSLEFRVTTTEGAPGLDVKTREAHTLAARGLCQSRNKSISYKTGFFRALRFLGMMTADAAAAGAVFSVRAVLERRPFGEFSPIA